MFALCLILFVYVCRPLQSSRRLSSWPSSNRLELPRPRLHPARRRLLLLATLKSLRLPRWPELLLCLMQLFW